MGNRPRCGSTLGLAVGFLVLGDLRCCGSDFTGWVCGVYSAESILTMPVVTTLFRNLFDNIFTHFYGCRTVFNGVGPVAHPHITIWSSVQKVDSVLNPTATTDRPRSTHHITVPTLLDTVHVWHCPGRLCCCVGVLVCLCMCAVYVCCVCVCALCASVCPLRGLDSVLTTFW